MDHKDRTTTLNLAIAISCIVAGAMLLLVISTLLSG